MYRLSADVLHQPSLFVVTAIDSKLQGKTTVEHSQPPSRDVEPFGQGDAARIESWSVGDFHPSFMLKVRPKHIEEACMTSKQRAMRTIAPCG